MKIEMFVYLLKCGSYFGSMRFQSFKGCFVLVIYSSDVREPEGTVEVLLDAFPF